MCGGGVAEREGWKEGQRGETKSAQILLDTSADTQVRSTSLTPPKVPALHSGQGKLLHFLHLRGTRRLLPLVMHTESFSSLSNTPFRNLLHVTFRVLMPQSHVFEHSENSPGMNAKVSTGLYGRQIGKM